MSVEIDDDGQAYCADATTSLPFLTELMLDKSEAVLTIEFESSGSYSPQTWDSPEEGEEERLLTGMWLDDQRVPDRIADPTFDALEDLVYEASVDYDDYDDYE